MNSWRKFWSMNKKVMLTAAAVLLAAVLSLCLGAASLGGSMGSFIFLYVRLPRTLGCLLAGAALAVSGAVIQGVLLNRLASPSIIGINAGAGLGVTVCCAAGLLSGWAIAGAAFLGAMGAAVLIVSLARRTGASRTTVILGGVAVNAFLNALSQAVTTLVPEAGMLSGEFRVGGFSAVSYVRLIPAGVLILTALVAVFLLHNELDVLALGEETARGLGLDVQKIRLLLLLLAAMLSGCAVSFAGLLGFVGLMVPHAMRRLVGSESRVLLPLCAGGGAAFVTLCDTAARVVFAPYEFPVGIVLSVLGGPFFLTLLLKRKGGRQDA
ncbi:MAG: iron ABC transporter permease [Oscillospiraceae bacterium]|nr:iron ABC transporter permease [Oscillospiraceae bacterium]MBR3949637.1 iron ABC transporter permease [Oscillospiraceae bacterium]